MKPPQNKYGVAPDHERRLDGVLYASKAEMHYAARLTVEFGAGTVNWWLRQVPVQLGRDTIYRVDFLVSEPRTLDGKVVASFERVHAVDVKGFETKDFKRIKRLWAKYGPFPLHVVKGGNTVEVIEVST